MVHCRIAALPKRHPDALHDEIMNFAALFEGGFTQRFINRLGQVDAKCTISGRGRRSGGFLGGLVALWLRLAKVCAPTGFPAPSRGILAITSRNAIALLFHSFVTL